jgi:hypothetical protein
MWHYIPLFQLRLMALVVQKFQVEAMLENKFLRLVVGLAQQKQQQENFQMLPISHLLFQRQIGTLFVVPGLYDQLTGGNLFYIATLGTPKTVNNGDGAPKILAGQLRITRASCP